MKTIPVLLATALLASACSSGSNVSKKISTNSFKSAQEIERDVFTEIQEGAMANERQFQLLDELTMANRIGKHRKDINLVDGLPAQVQVQSTKHPETQLSQSEVFKMLKEGDTGRKYDPKRGKLQDGVLSTENINIPQPQSIQQMEKYKMSKYSQQQQISMGKKTPISEQISKYLGNTNNVPQNYQTYHKNETAHKANMNTAKKNIHNQQYVDFQVKITGVNGEYLVNDLLAKIAKTSGYKLIINDPQEKGKDLKINTGNGFKGTVYDALMGVTTALKQKNAGKIHVNKQDKQIRVTYH